MGNVADFLNQNAGSISAAASVMLTMITGFYAYLIKKNAELQHQPRVFAEFTGAGDKRRVWIRFKNIGGSLAADISLSICPAIARETGPPAERVFIHALEPGQPYHFYAGEVEPDFVNQNDTVNFQLDYKDMYGKKYGASYSADLRSVLERSAFDHCGHTEVCHRELIAVLNDIARSLRNIWHIDIFKK